MCSCRLGYDDMERFLCCTNPLRTHGWFILPLLPNEMDFPGLSALRTPSPTLVVNDINDDLYTLPEMKNADAILKQIYEKTGASERYRCSFYPWAA